ncbi:FAD-dependent oxidoreductase [Deinococcus cellulosilyticus]|uniref:Oxidoreductase n=1 Tax=Deinococcus cellulosilyticus (strain DSM 18568 / NBRC 106333 / KACC 11606 / 5516J-15) TaxID=1223518 RepID=A0A511MVW5_DEIC1|nr:FAD-dependent oxidoreductase [Deinococcus cellulosilyticus]GEM44725.1 oxidoreductase [Deinococcus cellulosilyticus NBRC 106333 = KACC 11606]
MPTYSHWMMDLPEYPALDRDLIADAVVIGGGIAGLSTAYQLALSGLKVVVLERDKIGSGETPRSSAQVTSSLDFFYKELVSIHGRDTTKLIYQSHSAAIDEIERITRAENIDCGFIRLPGYLVPAPGDEDNIQEEASVHRGLGFDTTLSDTPAYATGFGQSIRYNNQGQIHPLKYIIGLARAIENRGGAIFCSSPVMSYTGDHVVTEQGHTVHARHVVVASNAPVGERGKYSFRYSPYRTYIMTMKLTGQIEPALFYDTSDPYFYVRPDGDVLLIGGADHRVGEPEYPEQRWQDIEDWTRAHFPVSERVDTWSGQVFNSADGIGFLGKAGDVYVITGDTGNGLTNATIGSMIIRDQVLGVENPWAEVYSPNRMPRGNYTEWVSEAGRSIMHLFDWFRSAEMVQNLQPGQGNIVRKGMSKYAVYRDEHGELHACSAMCTHMGCEVSWNSAEETWDCPCHGSRFTRDGEVLTGPARAPLAKIKEPQLE